MSVSLANVAMGQREAGNLPASVAAYGEAVALRRRRIADVGETPQALVDLAISLADLGGVMQDTDREQAAAAMEESLSLFRRWVEVLGETPQTMGECADRLSTVATVRRELGDHKGAEAAAEEAETIRRRLQSIGVGRAE